MLTIPVIILLLGICSSVAAIGEAFSLHKQKLFMFVLAAWGIGIIQYSLVEQPFLVAISIVGVIRTFMVLASVKYSWLNHIAFIPFFLIVHTILFIVFSDWSSITWFEFIPLFAVYGGTISGFFNNLIYIKLISISNGTLWLYYQYMLGLYGQLPGEAINLGINFWALIVLIQAYRNHIPLSEVKEVNVRIREAIVRQRQKIKNKH